MNQTIAVMRHLKENKGITTFEAFTEYGVTRLSAIIFNLRKNYEISDEWVERVNRYGDTIRFKRYILERKK